MPQLNLTAKTIDGLRLTEDGQVEDRDATLKGFGVRVSRSGTSNAETKTFFVRYRVGKRMRRLTIGDVDRIGLADARAKARAVLVKVDDGDDPAVARAVARRAETFGESVGRVLQSPRQAEQAVVAR